MAFVNGADPAAERHAADNGESGQSGLQSGPKAGSQAIQSGPDDVTITIRGSKAARMLGRGDAEDRILTELAGLRQRLDSMAAAAARQATDHEALEQTVQGLHDRVAQLSDQVAVQVTELRTALASLRSDFSSHTLGAVHLPGQVERLQGQLGLLQSQLSPLPSRLANLEMQLANLEHLVAPPPPPRPASDLDAVAQADGASGPKQPGWLWDKLDKWRQPDKPSANGEATTNGSWLKQRLNSLWLW